MQVATEVGISPSMLRNRLTTIHTGAARSRAVAAGVPPLPSPADQPAEIARLKRDLDRTRMASCSTPSTSRPYPAFATGRSSP